MSLAAVAVEMIIKDEQAIRHQFFLEDFQNIERNPNFGVYSVLCDLMLAMLDRGVTIPTDINRLSLPSRILNVDITRTQYVINRDYILLCNIRRIITRLRKTTQERLLAIRTL